MFPENTIVIVTCGATVELFHYVAPLPDVGGRDVLWPIPRGAMSLPVTDAEILTVVQHDLIDMNDDGKGRKSSSLNRMVKAINNMRAVLNVRRKDIEAD